MKFSEYIEIGSSPSDEDCAQVGSEDYDEMSYVECVAYRDQVKRIVEEETGRPIEELPIRLSIKSSNHDYGMYYDVIVKYDQEDVGSVDLAYWIDENTPESWDDVALKTLGRVR